MLDTAVVFAGLLAESGAGEDASTLGRSEVGGRQAEKHFACAHSLALDESTEGERAATMTFHDYQRQSSSRRPSHRCP